jgi:hypothetical protein
MSERRRGIRTPERCATRTADQNAGLAAQERDLKAAGCTKLFSEQVSSVASRDKLKARWTSLARVTPSW